MKRFTMLLVLLALLAVPIAVGAQYTYPDEDQMGGGGGATGGGSAGGGIQIGGAPPMTAGAAGGASMGQEEGGVTIVDFSFRPSAVFVGPGDSVTWTNEGAAPHTATANGGAFDSGELGPGGSYTYTFDSGGVFPYHCEIHPSMRGMVVVTGA
jgi:plastocyanin